MTTYTPVERVINLLDPDANLIFNMSVDQALEQLGTGDPEAVRRIDGQFALARLGDLELAQVDGFELLVAARVGGGGGEFFTADGDLEPAARRRRGCSSPHRPEVRWHPPAKRA